MVCPMVETQRRIREDIQKGIDGRQEQSDGDTGMLRPNAAEVVANEEDSLDEEDEEEGGDGHFNEYMSQLYNHMNNDGNRYTGDSAKEEIRKDANCNPVHSDMVCLIHTNSDDHGKPAGLSYL